MNLTTATSDFRKLSELPNKEGFRFKAILKNGNVEERTVQFNSIHGTYFVPGYSEMIGWYPIGKEK